MAKSLKNNYIRKVVIGVIILVFGAFMAILEWFPLPFSKDVWYNAIFNKTLQQISGIVAGVLFLQYLNVKLFKKPTKWLYLIPCLLIAVNNFQWWSYFSGLQRFVRTNALDYVIFIIYCLSVGMFEEFIFRGVLFSVLAGYFSKTKKGLIATFVVSSLLFGIAHLFNFNILQVLYTILTGGLFAFTLIKTKNLLCCGLVHAVYNICGLIMDSQASLGLGSGAIIFNVGTVLTMGIPAVIMVAFVLYSLIKYPEEERKTLYERLGVNEKTENTDNTEENQ